MKSITSAILAATLCFGPATPQFDVVSIMPSRSDDRNGGMRPIAGGFSARNMSVNMLVQSAYNLKPWQIVGGPRWVTTDRYDIEAKKEGNPGFREKLEMFRPLLADRFQLKFHRETRQMSVYSVTVAKNGPKLQAAAAGARGPIRSGRGLVEGKGVTMRTFADLLGGSLGQPVTDKSGITGAFDIKLQWTPAESETNYNDADRPLDPNAPSVFTAVQEQLGLKLQPGKGPLEVLVIDHIQRPSPN